MKTAAEILNIDDIEIKTVRVDEWDTDLIISVLSGKERDEIETSILKRSKNQNWQGFKTDLILKAVVNDKGEKFFSNDKTTKQALEAKSSKVIEKLADEILEFNKISQDDIDELEGN